MTSRVTAGMKLSTSKNMRIGLLLGALVIGAAMVGAQEPGRQRRGGGFGGPGGGMQMGRGGGSLIMLALRPDVQRDIGVTDEQKQALQALAEKQREGRPGVGARGERQGQPGGDRQGQPGGERQPRGQGGRPPGAGDPEEMRRLMEERRAQHRKDLAAILSEAQVKRLEEISVQLRGQRAIFDPEIQKSIGFTEQQHAKVRELMEAMREAGRSLMEKARGGEITREDAMAAMQRNEEALNAELQKLLSETQRKKLADMAGKPFSADPEQVRERRGGRGGE